MNFGVYGILIIFGAFVLLLILNPNLSCFGKRIKSPLYPLLRRRSSRTTKVSTEDYGFDLGGKESGGSPTSRRRPPGKKAPPSEDYGFHLQDKTPKPASSENSGGERD